MSNINLNAQLSKNELLQKLTNIQNILYKTQLSEQQCKINLNSLTEKYNRDAQISDTEMKNTLLNKIYNPLVPPERIYPGGRFNTPGFTDYQLIGFIYNNTERYPLYGRPKYRGKSSKYEYYIIDETRNKLKIPFKSKNDEELFTGDKVNIQGIGSDFIVTIYEYDNLRYDPTIF
jgi:hypothetical protein